MSSIVKEIVELDEATASRLDAIAIDQDMSKSEVIDMALKNIFDADDEFAKELWKRARSKDTVSLDNS